MSGLLVPGDTPGLTIREHDKIGRRLGSNGELVVEDCRVPAENLVGEEGKSTLMGSVKSPGRGMPRFQAMNLGIGRAAYEAALEDHGSGAPYRRPLDERQLVSGECSDQRHQPRAPRNSRDAGER